MRRVHDESEHLLERKLRLLDLVAYQSVMLTAQASLVPVLGLMLAAVAGFAQLFSP